MSYSTAKLKTAAECDQAIALANARKQDLLFEQTIQGKEFTDQQKTTAQNNANLISVKAQITGTEAAIAELPEGDDKKEMQSKLRRLNDRKDNLIERIEKGGNPALLDTELDAALLAKQIAEIDVYIAEVTAHKATL